VTIFEKIINAVAVRVAVASRNQRINNQNEYGSSE
jgi:hypothetical protein